MLLMVTVLALAMLWSGQQSPMGRRLRRWLVEGPAAWLTRRRAWGVAVVLASILAVVAAIHLSGGDAEAIKLVGMGVAEGASWFVAFDVGVYIEAYAVLVLLGSTRMVRAAVREIGGRLAAVRALRRVGARRERAVRTRPDKARRPPPDPDPARWWPAPQFSPT